MSKKKPGILCLSFLLKSNVLEVTFIYLSLPFKYLTSGHCFYLDSLKYTNTGEKRRRLGKVSVHHKLIMNEENYDDDDDDSS